MNGIRTVFLGVLVVLSGCSSPASDRRMPGPRPLAADLAGAPDATPAGPEEQAPRPDGVLTLPDTLRLVLRHNPDLASSAWELRAADARARQAGLLPNPELEIEVEEFGGGRELAGFGGSEATLGLAQALPLGGRLGDGRRAAALARETAGWEHEAKRLEVVAATMEAFAAVLAAQERRSVGDEAVTLGDNVLRSVTRQVEAGKVAPLEASKARVERSLLRLRRDRQSQELDARRRTLAALWGEADPTFDRVEGRLDRLQAIPAEERILAWIGENPELARAGADLARHEAEVDLAKAEAIPDLVLHAAIKHFEESEDQAFAAGLSIDLPLFDRNQGGVAEARANLRKARAESRATAVRVRAELAGAYRDLVLATGQAQALRDEVVPTARTAFEGAQEGFREGKNGLLEVLDAQRTFVDARGELIDALEAYHAAAAAVERLVGRSLDDLVGESPEDARKEPHDAR